MKVVCISDTHWNKSRTPDANPYFKIAGDHNSQLQALDMPTVDLLIHAGDHTAGGTVYEWREAMHWLGSQDARLKVTIPGNHDFYAQEHPAAAKEIAADYGVHLLVDEWLFMDPPGEKNHVIHGSPWTPWFHDWAYNFAEGEKGRTQAIKTWNRIPSDTTILITHGPAYGRLDDTLPENEWDSRVGCPNLALRLRDLKALKLHVFGHIHESYGLHRAVEGSRLISVNASTCDRNYAPINKPVVVDL